MRRSLKKKTDGDGRREREGGAGNKAMHAVQHTGYEARKKVAAVAHDAEATVTTAEEWSVSACDSAEGVGRDALLVAELIWWTAELSTVCGEDVGVAAIFDVDRDEAGDEVEGGHAADHGYG